jgi:hypothetical protein
MDIVERLRSPEVFIMQEPMISRFDVAYEAADEIEWLREERHALRKVLQFYASFATNTLPYSNIVDYLIDNGKLAALALKEGE